MRKSTEWQAEEAADHESDASPGGRETRAAAGRHQDFRTRKQGLFSVP
jgi:hypothetical protein